MSLPTSIGAYDDCKNLFEAAQADPKGARALAGEYKSAIGLRTRMHYFRKLDRDANSEMYPVDHPMHNRSIYDQLMIELIPDEDSQWWLYITPRADKILAVEGLSEVGDLIPIESTATEVHSLEDHSEEGLS